MIVPPASGTVDGPVTVTVQAQKADNSVDTGYQQDVTLMTGGSATGGGLVNIVNGVGTKNISDTVAESVTLALSDSQSTGLNVSSMQPLAFAAGATASYTLSDAVGMVAGNRVAYTVSRSDQYGNAVTSGADTSYLYSSSASAAKKFYNAATGGSVITSISIPNGAHSAAFWYYDENPGTYTITSSDNASAPDGAAGINDGTDSVSVLASPLSSFQVSAPAASSAGNRAGIFISRKDVLGDLMTSGTSTLYLYSTSAGANKKFYDAATGGSVIASATIQNGTSSVEVWYYDETPGSYTVTASDNASAPDGATGVADGTDSLAVVPGAVATFILSNPGDMLAKTRLGYTVSRQDSFGNVVTAGTTTVYLYTNSTGSAAKFYDDSLAGSVVTAATIASGHSSTNFWYYDEAGGTWTVTTSDNASAPDGAAGIADATDSVVVTPVAVKFVILPPASGTVDAPVTVTIQAQKPDNSIDASYQQDVSLGVNGSAIGGGLVNIVNGVGTKNISDTVAEPVTLALSDSQSTGLDISSTQPLTFAGGAIAQFVLDHPGTGAAGDRVPYTIVRKDQYGNASDNGTSTVYLYSTSGGVSKKFYDAAIGGNVITSITIPSGQSSASVWYYDELMGSYNITASDNASAPDGNVGINDAVDTLAITAGPVSQILLNHPGDVTAGTRLGYTVVRKDQFNNLVTAGATSVYLYSNSTGSSSPAFYDAANAGSVITALTIPGGQSSAHAWYLDPNAGTWIVTASDNASAPDGAAGINDATDSVTVNAAPIVATRYLILPPTNGTVDGPISVTIQAQDANGNIDTTYQTDVTLNASGSAAGGGVVHIVNGVATISLTDTAAQDVTLTLVDSQSTGLDVSSSRTVTFAPGAAAQFSLDNPGDEPAGMRIGYTLTRKDQYGNLVTTGATTAYLYSTSNGVNKKFYDAATGGSAISSIIIPNGQSSVQFWQYDEKAGNWFVTASDNAVAPDGVTGMDDASDAVLVQPAAVASLTLNDPGNMTAGTRLGYTITRKDAFGNLVTTGVTLAYLYSTSAATTTAFYDVATGGSPVTFATINDGQSAGAFWYSDHTPGSWLVTASDNATAPDGAAGVQDAVDSVTVSAIPIVATHFVIMPVSNVQIGTPVTVTVQAEDNSGNIDASYQQDVTLVLGGSATGGGLVNIINGVGTKVINDTTAESMALSLSDTQSTGLDVSSTQSLSFTATPVPPSAAGVTGGGGGAPYVPPPVITGVKISGLAFAKAHVDILAVSPTGTNLKGETTAAANGTFTVTLDKSTAGASEYSLLGVDALGRVSQARIFSANAADKNSILNLQKILLSPTLGLVHPVVRTGDVVGLVGIAVPGYTIDVQIDGKPVAASVKAGADGSYKLLVSTGALALGSHVARVRQVSPSGTSSEFAPQKVFNVTTLFVPQTDFNQDGVVNVADWSVFLSRWQSTNAALHQLDDLNGDGKVDIADRSIFTRTRKK